MNPQGSNIHRSLRPARLPIPPRPHINLPSNNIPYAISLSVSSGIVATKLDVKYIVGTKKHQVFSSKNENENREIISKIFSDVL